MEAEEPTDAHKNQRETDLLRSLKPLPHKSKANMAGKHREPTARAKEKDQEKQKMDIQGH